MHTGDHLKIGLALPPYFYGSGIVCTAYNSFSYLHTNLIIPKKGLHIKINNFNRSPFYEAYFLPAIPYIELFSLFVLSYNVSNLNQRQNIQNTRVRKDRNLTNEELNWFCIRFIDTKKDFELNTFQT